MATKAVVDERTLVLTVIVNCDEGDGVDVPTIMQRTGIKETAPLKKAVKSLKDEGLIDGSAESGTFRAFLTEKGQKYATKHELYDQQEEETAGPEEEESDPFDDAFGDFDEPEVKSAKAAPKATAPKQEAKLFDTTSSKSPQAKAATQKTATPTAAPKATGTPAKPATTKPAATPAKGPAVEKEKPAIRALSSMTLEELTESHAHCAALADALFESGDPLGCEGLARSVGKIRKFTLRTFGVDLGKDE